VHEQQKKKTESVEAREGHTKIILMVLQMISQSDKMGTKEEKNETEEFLTEPLLIKRVKCFY
jgi:hypothetical protein